MGHNSIDATKTSTKTRKLKKNQLDHEAKISCVDDTLFTSQTIGA